MKRKPLSFEEKRQRLLKIFHERVIFFCEKVSNFIPKQEVLNLKELEKYGPKEGIGLINYHISLPIVPSVADSQRCFRQSFG